MTRRVAVAGVLAVCFTALMVGAIAYVLVSREARRYEDRLLVNLAAHPRQLLAPRATLVDLGQLTEPTGAVSRRTVALAALGRLPALAPGFANVTLGHRQLRVLTKLLPRGQALSVAVYDAPARASLRRLRRGVLIAMLAGALLASTVLVWITRRALAPVRETAGIADRIVSTGDLTARVPERSGEDEIASLTRSLNRMLDHLQASDAALRRLVADASHELRSPVTTLRGNLELLDAGALHGPDRDAAVADARAEAERLGRLVEELLVLARSDTVRGSERVVLLPLVRQAIAGCRARLMTPPDSLASAAVSGDPVSLRALVRNLVDNAERYAGGAEVALGADGTQVTLAVIDHGPGIPPGERDAVFGRFTRGAGTTNTSGSGLGLAIVAATAHAHGGTVTLSETPGGGATFTVRMPRAD